VTCYHYKDDNNQWTITPTWEAEPLSDSGEIRYLKDNDVVRLVHTSTGRNLHSHPIAAPVSKLNNEISCYGNSSIGDSNDYWVIEVVDDSAQGKKKNVKRIHSLTTRLRIRHQNSGCYVRAANTVLPQWGFKQIEVSCDKENNVNDVHTYWNIESHWNERRQSEPTQLDIRAFLRSSVYRAHTDLPPSSCSIQSRPAPRSSTSPPSSPTSGISTSP
jgi:dolichyl-phosphate-mannose-protein mannosyltransferase